MPNAQGIRPHLSLYTDVQFAYTNPLPATQLQHV